MTESKRLSADDIALLKQQLREVAERAERNRLLLPAEFRVVPLSECERELMPAHPIEVSVRQVIGDEEERKP